MLCSVLVSAASQFVLKVSSDDPITKEQAKEDLKAHPFVLYFKLGVYYFYSGKFTDAIGAFKKAIDLKPDFAEAYHNIGVSYHEMGNVEESIGYFEKSVDVNKEYLRGYFSLGLAYYETKEYAKALEAFNKLTEIDDKNAQAFFNLAIISVEKFREEGENNIEELKQGLFYYNKCLELDSSYPHSQQNKEIVEKVLNELTTQ